MKFFKMTKTSLFRKRLHIRDFRCFQYIIDFLGRLPGLLGYLIKVILLYSKKVIFYGNKFLYLFLLVRFVYSVTTCDEQEVR